MSLRYIAGLFFALMATVAHAQHHGAPPRGVVHFDLFADGDTLHLLTGDRRADRPGIALWYRRSTDAGATWSEPVRVNADGEDMFAPHPGENAQIAARGDVVLAMWTPIVDGKPRAPVTALSQDGGRTFVRAAGPAADGSDDYHPLPELGADARGFDAVWLHGARRDAEGHQGLHYAHSSDGKTWDAVQTVDAATCECCWNRLVANGVLYRAGGPRDMKFARRDGGQWSEGVEVGKFDWEFAGCPHTGGALASSADGKALHAIVWTGREDVAGLYYVASRDGGKRWGEPKRLGAKDAVDADITLARDGSLRAVWDTDSAIMSARSRDGGKTWSAPEPLSHGGERSRHPRAAGELTLWLEGPREATVLTSSRGPIATP